MVAEWDREKARLNFQKHGVSFPDSVTALEDDRALTERDMSADEDERWVTMGMDGLGRVLVVVYPGAARTCVSSPRDWQRSASVERMRNKNEA